MKNKFITAVAVLTLGASLAVAAPGGGKYGGKHGKHGDFSAKFEEKLNLTDAQKAQIRAIRQESREQNATFFDGARATMQEFKAARKANDTAKAESLKATVESQRAQMKQIRDAEKQRILSILTPEQRTQFEQMKTEKRGKRQ